MKKAALAFMIGIFSYLSGMTYTVLEVWAQARPTSPRGVQAQAVQPQTPPPPPLQPVVPRTSPSTPLQPVVPEAPSSSALQPVAPRTSPSTPLQPVVPQTPPSSALQPVVPQAPSSVPFPSVVVPGIQVAPGIPANVRSLLAPVRANLLQARTSSRGGDLGVADQHLRSAIAELTQLQQQFPDIAPQIQQAQSDLSEALRLLDRNRVDEAARTIGQAEEDLGSLLGGR